MDMEVNLGGAGASLLSAPWEGDSILLSFQEKEKEITKLKIRKGQDFCIPEWILRIIATTFDLDSYLLVPQVYLLLSPPTPRILEL